MSDAVVKILVVHSKDGNLSFYTDTDQPNHPLNPEIRIYEQTFESPCERKKGYAYPTYAPQTFKESD